MQRTRLTIHIRYFAGHRETLVELRFRVLPLIGAKQRVGHVRENGCLRPPILRLLKEGYCLLKMAKRFIRPLLVRLDYAEAIVSQRLAVLVPESPLNIERLTEVGFRAIIVSKPLIDTADRAQGFRDTGIVSKPAFLG